MIPNVGNIVYFIYYGKVCIFEILKVQPIDDFLSPHSYKFSVCVLSGDWPLDYIFVSESKLNLGNHIIPIEENVYMIFDEETFVNYIKTHEIAEGW